MLGTDAFASSALMSKRLFDITLAGLALILLGVPMLLIGLAVRLDSPGPALYWSLRVGRQGKPFLMPKFRSMRVGTPTMATHLLPDPESHVTALGRWLRRTSLDELPQLWSIVRGDMSLVGPRPALCNQMTLHALRETSGVHSLAPGLTGWAQVHGRDDLDDAEKAAYDAEYLRNRCLALDLRILFRTAWMVLRGEGVWH